MYKFDLLKKSKSNLISKIFLKNCIRVSMCVDILNDIIMWEGYMLLVNTS